MKMDVTQLCCTRIGSVSNVGEWEVVVKYTNRIGSILKKQGETHHPFVHLHLSPYGYTKTKTQ